MFMTTSKAFFTALLIAFSSIAIGHVSLVANDTTPAAEAVLQSSPAKIVIRFSGRIEPALSQITVVNKAKQEVARGNSSNPDKTRLEASLPELQPGTYLVQWSVVGTDTHRITGEYSFTIKPAK